MILSYSYTAHYPYLISIVFCASNKPLECYLDQDCERVLKEWSQKEVNIIEGIDKYSTLFIFIFNAINIPNGLEDALESFS